MKKIWRILLYESSQAALRLTPAGVHKGIRIGVELGAESFDSAGAHMLHRARAAEDQ